MSDGWAGVIVSFLTLLVPIFNFLIFDIIGWRMPKSPNRVTAHPPVEPYRTHPYLSRPLWTPATIAEYHANLTRRAQKWLKWSTLVVPLATLAYGLADVSVGTMFYFHLSSLAAAVVAFLFTAACTPLAELVGSGSYPAARAAYTICNIFSYMFVALSAVFGLATFFALTHIFGIEYFVAELENPGLVIVHTGILTALSAIVWQATDRSSDLLRAISRHSPSPF